VQDIGRFGFEVFQPVACDGAGQVQESGKLLWGHLVGLLRGIHEFSGLQVNADNICAEGLHLPEVPDNGGPLLEPVVFEKSSVVVVVEAPGDEVGARSGAYKARAVLGGADQLKLSRGGGGALGGNGAVVRRAAEVVQESRNRQEDCCKCDVTGSHPCYPAFGRAARRGVQESGGGGIRPRSEFC